MEKFHKEKRPSGRREGNRTGGRDAWQRDFGGRSESRPMMHDATCGKCGRDCQVPFRPNGKKPVYCGDCFRKEDGGGGNRPSFGEKRMFPAVCDTCGINCEVPFRPTGEKPIYCRECFGGKPKTQRTDKPTDVSSPRLAAMEAKLDKILAILNAATIEEVDHGASEPVVEEISESEIKPAKKEKAAKKESKKKKTAKT